MPIIASMNTRRLPGETFRQTPFHKIGKTTFTWIIKDFLNRPEERGESFRSPSFSVDVGDIKTEWQIDLYPKGKDIFDQVEDWVSIFLHSMNDFEVVAKFNISLLNSYEQNKAIIQIGLMKYGRDYKGCPKWIRSSEFLSIPSLLRDGNLKLEVDLTVEVDDNSLRQDCVTQIIDQFTSLFTDEESSDVEISCGGQVFHCHKLILSTRSPVFRAMFQNNMKEKETMKVAIEGIIPEVVAEMLKFIYTGTLSSNDLTSPTDLFKAANQYQLDLLKKVCEKKLCNTVTIENCLEYLGLADLYQTPELKTVAFQFIARNMTIIVKTEEYKDFLKNNLGLALEVTEAMAMMVKTEDKIQIVTESFDELNFDDDLGRTDYYDGYSDSEW